MRHRPAPLFSPGCTGRAPGLDEWQAHRRLCGIEWQRVVADVGRLAAEE